MCLLQRQSLRRRPGIPKQVVSVGDGGAAVGFNDAGRTSGKRRSAQNHSAGAIDLHRGSSIVIDEAALDERCVGHAPGAMQVHSAPIAGDRGILNKSASVGSSDNIDAVSCEIPDGALANDEFSSADHIDPVQARPQPFDMEPLQARTCRSPPGRRR